jgi:hypothetical protein
VAASALSLTGSGVGQTAAAGKPAPEFYELRKYQLTSGPQVRLTQDYFAKALIPGLNRLGIAPVGAFSVDIGPVTPAYYLLLPSPSVEKLVTADLLLAKDPVFVEAAAPFWNAPATAPAYDRIESTLLRAFEGWPKLTPPASHAPRIFQLRQYESGTNQDHVRKVEMFHSGEFDFFTHANFGQVFFGDSLIGPRLPNLTYMLCFPDMKTLQENWAIFSADPNWKKLSANPRFAFESIVSNITNLVLKPLASSQI